MQKTDDKIWCRDQYNWGRPSYVVKNNHEKKLRIKWNPQKHIDVVNSEPKSWECATKKNKP